jgi:hypothetical protein
VSTANEWVIPPGYRALADIVEEFGRDAAQAKLVSEQWTAFKLDLYTGDLEPIPATTWCVARGRTWLEEGASEFEEHAGEFFGYLRGPTIEIIHYAIIVSERQPRRQRKAPQADRVDQAIVKCFPSGADGIATKAVHKAVAEELSPDSKKRGLATPSESTVKRRLGRRK